MVKQGEALLQTKPASIYALYDTYAAMLLGYIHEVVKDSAVAEDYLQKTFTTIAKKFNNLDWNEGNNWSRVLYFAKAELKPFYDTAKGYETPSIVNNDSVTTNKYLDKMTEQQRLVFCSIYYSKKTTAELSQEINMPGEQIKALLKEAFSIIKNADES